MLCPRGTVTTFKVLGGQSCSLVEAVPPGTANGLWNVELRAVYPNGGSYVIDRFAGVGTAAGEPTRRVVAMRSAPGAIGFEVVVRVGKTCPANLDVDLFVSDTMAAAAPPAAAWT